MSAAYVRRHYTVDYKRGDRIAVDGKRGTIVSFPDQYLGVRFDGEKHTSRAHPTWRVERLAHEFTENINDASMCICGIPALTHDAAMASRLPPVQSGGED